MVHGGCKSVGCYAMTDYEMEEIYGLVDEAFKGGQDKIQLEAFPFGMTAQNLARHAKDPNAPFWQMLKMEATSSLRRGNHRRLLSAISAMCSIRLLRMKSSIRALLARPASSISFVGALQSPQSAPAIAIPPDQSASYRGD